MGAENELQLVRDIRDQFLWAVWCRYVIAALGLALFLSTLTSGGLIYGLGLAAFLAAYNLLAHLLFVFHRGIRFWEILLARFAFQVLDIFCVTFLVYITGWLESPYWFLYLVLIILSGFGVFSVWSAWSVFLIAFFSSLFYLGLLLSTYAGWLPVYGPGFTLTSEQLLESIANKAVFTTISFFLLAATVYYFSRLLSQHRAELLKNNRQLQAAMEELKEVDQLKDEFISTASHELRTPLAVIRENISLIGDQVAGQINEQQRKLLESTLTSVDRLAKLLDSLLDISQLESRAAQLKRQRADLGALALKAIEMLKELADKKNISIVSRLEPDAQTWVDAGHLFRVFINLIDNAIKYTARNGRITVTVSVLGDKVRGAVEDDGIGIPEKDLPQVFRRFVRLNSGLEMSGGYGLGLSICKAIIELHGGRIWAESKLGLGSRFVFELPKGELNE
ncbi:MAG: HAMP domain-containing histidine kinase [Candidatus Saganbacteria bacterium]|nr:HAMP domain-containing histidine kinase [Candidatus Saganbacteria bacterium]